MSVNIEALKRMNLVDFLTEHYGCEFQRAGRGYVCRSPFTEDKRASFFVRIVEGHWLFKDFSSGTHGTIFDFIRIKEKLHSFAAVLAHIRAKLSHLFSSRQGSTFASSEDSRWAITTQGDLAQSTPQASYDISGLYERFRQEDASLCRQYLIGRGIAENLVNELVAAGIVVHNLYQGKSYCCFAVCDAKGELQCLDNHQIGGEGKFVLGRKNAFSLDWSKFPEAEEVFIAESIIDYLSIKTIEGAWLPGLALLGNKLCFDPGLLANTQKILAAVDDDRGGYSLALDLMECFPDKKLQVYALEGHKDPNELLMAKGRRLSPKRKLQLYHEFLQASNKSELARRWGMDRSYIYEIVAECEKTLLDMFAERRPGRRPSGKPQTLEEAQQRIEESEAKYESMVHEKELLYCSSEFLKLRLKWAEIEAAEARGETVDEESGPRKKTQVKKKRKRRNDPDDRSY